MGRLMYMTVHQLKKLLKRVSDAEIVYTNKTPLTKEVLEKTSKYKIHWSFGNRI